MLSQAVDQRSVSRDFCGLRAVTMAHNERCNGSPVLRWVAWPPPLFRGQLANASPERYLHQREIVDGDEMREDRELLEDDFKELKADVADAYPQILRTSFFCTVATAAISQTA